MKKQELLEYDYYLNEISKQISFYLINPLNIVDEKVKFMNSTTYNPQFQYRNFNVELLDIKHNLQKDFINSSIIGEILNTKRQEYIKKIEMITHIGEPEFGNFSVNVYGLPTEELVDKAKELIKIEDDSPTEPIVNSIDLEQYFQKAIRDYGFDWNVQQKKMIANAAVSPSKRTLYLKEGAKFSEKFLKRLIVHEIGTHALRAENGYLQEFTIFRRGLPGYMSTEEGLAVMNEELNGCLNKKTLKIYAARVIAVSMSLKYSFRDIYNYLIKYFSPDISWRTALRSKRGVSDTALGGGLTKDYLYLAGYYRVKSYIGAGNDINKLYIGKIGIEHVGLIEKMGLGEPKFLPKSIEVTL